MHTSFKVHQPIPQTSLTKLGKDFPAPVELTTFTNVIKLANIGHLACTLPGAWAIWLADCNKEEMKILGQA